METTNKHKSIGEWIKTTQIPFPNERQVKIDLGIEHKQPKVIRITETYIYAIIDDKRQAIISLQQEGHPECAIHEANRVVAIYKKHPNQSISPEVVSKTIKITISAGDEEFSYALTTDIAIVPRLPIKYVGRIINGEKKSLSVPTSTAAVLIGVIKFFLATGYIPLNSSLQDAWTTDNTPSTPAYSSKVPYQTKGDEQAIRNFYQNATNIIIIHIADANRKIPG